MIKCPQCEQPVSNSKFLFKTDYSIVECDNCGYQMKIKINRNFSGIIGALTGALNGLLAYTVLNFLGLLQGLGLLILILLVELGLIAIYTLKKIDNFVNIVH